jgi:hypothetical protein
LKWTRLAPLLVLALSTAAEAEKLTFDHRTYPPLVAVLDSGRTEMIKFDASNPRYVTDRIVIQGTSADHWTEALDIIVRSRKAKMQSPADWASQIQQAANAQCPSTFTTISEDASSLTFERHSSGCPAGTAQSALYRIVAGKTSLYLLNPLVLGEMPEAARQQWLALLATAHIDG